jgi:hypothetical protein
MNCLVKYKDNNGDNGLFIYIYIERGILVLLVGVNNGFFIVK